jgi:hypothetical protein
MTPQDGPNAVDEEAPPPGHAAAGVGVLLTATTTRAPVAAPDGAGAPLGSLVSPASASAGLEAAGVAARYLFRWLRPNAFALILRGLHSDAFSSFPSHVLFMGWRRQVRGRGQCPRTTSQPERPGASRHVGEPRDCQTYASAKKIHVGSPRGQCFSCSSLCAHMKPLGSSSPSPRCRTRSAHPHTSAST